MGDPIEDLSVEQEMARQQQGLTPPLEDPTKAGPVVPAAVTASQPDDLGVEQQMVQEGNDERDLQAQLLQYRAGHDKVDAGKRADVLLHSAATGLTPDFVEQNLDDVRAKVKAANVDWRDVTRRQPGLVNMLQETPEALPLVKDDVAKLGGIEWAINAPFHAFWDAVNEQRATFRQFIEATGAEGSGYDNRMAIKDLQQRYANKDYGNDGAWSTGTIAIARMAPYIGLDLLSRSIGTGIAAFIAGGETAAVASETGPGAVPAGAAGAVAGGVLGEFVASGLFNYYEALGPNYERISNLRDATGQPLPPELTQALAQASAVTTGLMMAGFFGKVGGSLAKPIMARFGADTIERAVADASIAQLIKRGGLEWGKHWVTGAALMGASSGANQAFVNAGEDISGQPFGERASVVDATAEGIKGGIRDMWLLSAIGPGVELVKEIGRGRASAEGAVRYDVLTKNAAESQLLGHSPELFQKAIEQMQRDPDSAQNVHVPVEEWTRYWQSKKLDPAEVAAQVMGDEGKGFAETQATKGDLTIPLKKFFATFGATEHAKGLAKDVKLFPEDLTPRQFGEEIATRAKQMAEAAKVRKPELETGKKEVADFIRTQAVKAGIESAVAEANAALVSEYAGNMALRLGVSVQEAARLGSLGQLRILGPKGERVAAAAQERFSKFQRPSSERFLEQRLASMLPEARAQEFFVDPVSGLRDRRAFDALNETPEGKQVAVITSPDVKGINEHPTHGGHGITDEMLRQVGASIGEGHPEAARGGTNFLLHVKDQAELDQVLERARRGLGDQKLNVIGALGETPEKAFGNLDKNTDALRVEGKLPERGGLNEGTDVSKLKFGDERGAGTVPDALKHEIAKLSDTEYAQRAYVDRVKVGGKDVASGLLTRVAWNALPRKANAAMMDLTGLKAANAIGERAGLGKDLGNQFLLGFSKLVAKVGGSSFDATHLSGDEYALQHDDPVELERFIKRLEAHISGVVVSAVDPASGKRESVPVKFRHGIGKDLIAADRELSRKKSLEGKVGPGVDGQGDGRGHLGAGGHPGADAGEARRVGAGSEQQGEVGAAARSGDAAVSGGTGGVARGGESDSVAPREASRPFQPDEVVAHVEGSPVVYTSGPRDGSGPRGSISLQLDPTGRPRSMAITAFAGDRSTLMHETAHFLSWSFHDIAESALATPQIQADYAGLLKWAGFASTKDRLFKAKEVDALQRKADRTPAEDAKLKKLSAGEEKIAHGFEQYLLEGKAPSAALSRVFSKFRGWLMGIYKGLPGIQQQYASQHGEELGLSNDVRDIFDRLLSQDRAIEQARRDIGEGPPGTTPPPIAQATMTPAEREAHATALEASRIASERELTQRTTELHNGQVEDLRATEQKAVAKELDQLSVYRAERFLEHGELVDEKGDPLAQVPSTLLNKDGQPFQLERKSVVDGFGKEAAARMRNTFAPKGEGVDIEELAPLLGFQDGAAMVDAFKFAPPRDETIAKQTQERVSAAFAPALEEVAKAALSAVHNEHTAMATLLDIRALAKQVDPGTAARVKAIDLGEMKRTAQRLIDEKGIGDLDPDAYARAERNAAVKAAALWAGGDKQGSIEQRVGRLFNQQLYRAARDALDRADRVQAKLASTSEAIRGNLGKADPAYRDAHDAILGAVGLGPEVKGGGQSFDAMVAKAGNDGHLLDFDADAIRKLLEEPHDWDQLSVAEAKNIGDAVTNIRHAARDTLEVDLIGKREAKANFLSRMLARISSVRPPQPRAPYSRTAEGFRDKGRRLRRGGQALLEDVETWAEMLDGGTSGPAHELLVQSRIACRTKENDLTAGVLKVIKEKWENVPKDIKKLKGRVVDVGDLLPVKNEVLAPIFTRDTLWSLFLNWGSEGNRQRIRDGNGWSDENVNKALQLLSKPETDFLQGVTDAINSLYPELAAVHEKRTGLKLGKVDALPVVIGGETYPGGYHPLKYDARSSTQGERQEVQQVKDLMGSSYQRPTLPSSHTKGRVEKVDAPVDLTWGTVPAHLSQVIRDISYGDWVRQAGSLMLSPEFKGLTTKFLGEERAKEFVPWLRDVANARADSAAGHQSDFLRRFGAAAKSRISLAVMGLNVASLARHSFDPWSMMADSEAVAPHYIGRAYVSVMNPANWGSPDYALSKELANHEAQLDDNLRNEIAKIGPGGVGPITQAISSVAFYAHGLVHHFTARVCYRAAFDQAIGAGATPEEAAQRGDDVVRRALPSGDVADKPPILRQKGGIASAVMFYGYASKMHNLRARAFDAALRTWSSPESTPTDKMGAIAKVAGKLLAIGAVSSLGAYFAGRGWKKDENPVEWAMTNTLLDPLEGIPIVGPGVAKAVTGHKVDIATAPELALLGETLDRVQRLYEKAGSSGRKSDADLMWGAAEVLITAMGLAGFAQRTVGGFKAIEKHEVRPRGALDAAAIPLYGVPTDKSSVNPLEQLQTVISK